MLSKETAFFLVSLFAAIFLVTLCVTKINADRTKTTTPPHLFAPTLTVAEPSPPQIG